MSKVFVSVLARHEATGDTIPEVIIWEDGRCFPIDKVLDVRAAASLKAGGQGTRYTCDIQGNVRYLFCDNDGVHWFVEGKG